MGLGVQRKARHQKLIIVKLNVTPSPHLTTHVQCSFRLFAHNENPLREMRLFGDSSCLARNHYIAEGLRFKV